MPKGVYPRTTFNKGMFQKNHKVLGGFQKGNKIGLGKKMSEEAREKIRQWHIKNPNKKFRNTGIEIKMEQELIKREIEYKKQYPIEGIAIVDFFVPKSKTVIQCDGCFWHNCYMHYPNHHKEQLLKDQVKDRKLLEKGYNVMRFIEHDINTMVEKLVDEVIYL